MKPTTAYSSPGKRAVSLDLTDSTVAQARQFTADLSATVDSLLQRYVAEKASALLTQQKARDVLCETWNQFRSQHGSFADDHSI